MASPTDIRKGRVIVHNGTPHLVLEMLHRTQGRQAGFVQTTLRSLETGASTTTKFRSTDTVEILTTDTQKLEFSYVDSEGYHFLDPETFDDIPLPEAFVAETKDFLVEGNQYEVMFVDGKPMEINLPGSIEMTVTESAEGIKGDTASNVQKPATLETGLVVQVPLFIKEGEKIKVSTADKTYMGRA